MPNRTFISALEKAVGMSEEHIRRTPLAELREEIERRKGRPLRFVSAFPFIGRGNILRDRAVSHAAAEQVLHEVLADDV